MRVPAAIPLPRSVGSMILAGFGTLILILAVCVVGAVITVRNYKSTTHEMLVRSQLASELQTTQAQGGNAALLIQRYVYTGDDDHHGHAV